jgi:hypothetical protein
MSCEVDRCKLASLLPTVDLLTQLPQPTKGSISWFLALLLGSEIDAPFDEGELLRDIAKSPWGDGIVDTAETQKAELEAI